jgi:hypothetical protein
MRQSVQVGAGSADGSERVGDVSHFGDTVSHHYGHNVEANFGELRPAIGKPRRGEAMQPLLLTPPHRFGWLTPARRVTGLHLTENEQWPARCDYVDLSEVAPVVLVENSEPLFLQVLGSELLSNPSEAGSSVHAMKLGTACDRNEALALHAGRVGKHVALRELRQLLDIEIPEGDHFDV